MGSVSLPSFPGPCKTLRIKSGILVNGQVWWMDLQAPLLSSLLPPTRVEVTVGHRNLPFQFILWLRTGCSSLPTRICEHQPCYQFSLMEQLSDVEPCSELRIVHRCTRLQCSRLSFWSKDFLFPIIMGNLDYLVPTSSGPWVRFTSPGLLDPCYCAHCRLRNLGAGEWFVSDQSCIDLYTSFQLPVRRRNIRQNLQEGSIQKQNRL